MTYATKHDRLPTERGVRRYAVTYHDAPGGTLTVRADWRRRGTKRLSDAQQGVFNNKLSARAAMRAAERCVPMHPLAEG